MPFVAFLGGVMAEGDEDTAGTPLDSDASIALIVRSP